MLAVMEASQSAGPSNPASTAPPTPDSTTHTQEFLSSGRTGRRNALPDILGEHAVVTSSDLPSRLQGLSTADKPAEDQRNKPGTSKS
ncbi:cAMP-dependent protein kinase inhibitor alpha-like [Anoplophora glabripennis]|uniref:cAMP-dependent protein kinase inhibitor alpha-like n=1 Tax=Anoplophora glabripennis TaxID=217634 RepID=UPI000873E784|nr:cAMP-dependent protein kinase inhibitor alpha-like [Anoplophora glabripennis]